MSEEDEIRLRNLLGDFQDRTAFEAGAQERRKVPSIGYGTLFDDSDAVQDYTLTLDIALPEDDDHSCVTQLEAMVEQTIKQWLTDFAPSGTRTSLVEAIRE